MLWYSQVVTSVGTLPFNTLPAHGLHTNAAGTVQSLNRAQVFVRRHFPPSTTTMITQTTLLVFILALTHVTPSHSQASLRPRTVSSTTKAGLAWPSGPYENMKQYATTGKVQWCASFLIPPCPPHHIPQVLNLESKRLPKQPRIRSNALGRSTSRRLEPQHRQHHRQSRRNARLGVQRAARMDAVEYDASTWRRTMEAVPRTSEATRGLPWEPSTKLCSLREGVAARLVGCLPRRMHS